MYEIEVRELGERSTAVIRARVDRAEVDPWFAASYGVLAMHLQTIDVGTVGMPFARCAEDAEGFDVEAGLPVAQPTSAEGDIEPSSLPRGPAATTWHRGDYATAEPAYAAINDWLRTNGCERAGAQWEIHHADSSTDLDALTWMTEVVQPFTR